MSNSLLEDELQSKLNITVLLGIVDVVEETSARHLDRRVTVADVICAAGDEEIRMIEEIEEFSAELQLLRFSKVDIPEEADIPRLESWRTEGVAAECADKRPVD